jgi:hypothetical protein
MERLHRVSHAVSANCAVIMDGQLVSGVSGAANKRLVSITQLRLLVNQARIQKITLLILASFLGLSHLLDIQDISFIQ